MRQFALRSSDLCVPIAIAMTPVRADPRPAVTVAVRNVRSVVGRRIAAFEFQKDHRKVILVGAVVALCDPYNVVQLIVAFPL